jgi:hypothetical protein
MSAPETHTPTPWFIHYNEDGDPVSLAYSAKAENGGSIGVSIARFSIDSKYFTDAQRKANAEFIVTAVNSYSALQARVAKMEAALKFYADAWCFTTHPKRPGLEWKPKEALLDDCGNIARAALQGGSNG